MIGHKNVRFGLVLSEAARERLDRMASLQGCSRAELIDRALVNLELAMNRPDPVRPAGGQRAGRAGLRGGDASQTR